MAKVTGPNQFSLAVGHQTTAKVDDWHWNFSFSFSVHSFLVYLGLNLDRLHCIFICHICSWISISTHISSGQVNVTSFFHINIIALPKLVTFLEFSSPVVLPIPIIGSALCIPESIKRNYKYENVFLTWTKLSVFATVASWAP